MFLSVIAHVRHLPYKPSTVTVNQRLLPPFPVPLSRHIHKMPIPPALLTPDLQWVPSRSRWITGHTDDSSFFINAIFRFVYVNVILFLKDSRRRGVSSTSSPNIGCAGRAVHHQYACARGPPRYRCCHTE